ncbi:Nuf2 family-domain-containing protein [Pyronema omphalodes]|nr:Nuf2 family-domain-containing protein [Pyronema omphalodes]
MAYNSRQSNVFQMKTPVPSTVKKKQQPEQESFLVLDQKDIVACLNDLDIIFTLEDIRNPTPLKVQYVYERLVDVLLGLRRESIDPLTVPVINSKSITAGYDPESLHDPLVWMAFYCTLRDLMKGCGVQNFSFNDLNKPEPGRLRLNLSLVINFSRYRADKLDMANGVKDEHIAAQHRTTEIFNENIDLRERIERIHAQREVDAPQIEQVQKENRDIADRLKELKKKQTAVSNQYEQLRGMRKEHVSKLQNLQYMVEMNERECAKLRPCVMETPERLQLVLDDLRKQLDKEREGVDKGERWIKCFQRSEESQGIVHQEVVQLIDTMEEIHRSMAKLDETTKKVQRHQAIIGQKETEVREITRRRERLVRNLKTAEEKLEQERELDQQLREQAVRRTKQLGEEYNVISEELNRKNREIEREYETTKIQMQEMMDMKAVLDDEVSMTQAQFDRLARQITEYMTKMEHAMAGAAQVNSR